MRQYQKKQTCAALCTAFLMLFRIAVPAGAVSQDTKQLDAILEKIITDDMSEYDKLYAITKYTAENFAYTNAHVRYQHWYEMLEYGGGDCWANTDMIHMLCDKAGIRNIRHDGSLWDGASGHINLIALIDGKYYKAEAGMSGEKPRKYLVSDLGTRPFSYSVKENAATLTRYHGFEKEFAIPEEIDGTPLTTIGKYAFSTKQLTDYSKNNSKLCYQFWKWDFSHIESLKIPETVTTIETRAFMCSKLQAVTIPSAVKSLPEAAFYFSEELKTVTLPAGLTAIGENAFGDCNALTDVWFGGSQAEWDAITVAEGNEPLRNAKLHTADSPLLGDADGNGSVTADDAKLLRLWLTGQKAAVTAKNADMNADGRLDALDLTLLKRMLLK